MKLRILAMVAGACLITPLIYGQTPFAGKWMTDAAVAAQQRGAEAPAEGRGARGGGQAVVLDLKVDGDKLSGMVNEIGNGDPLTITEGTITGKTFTFKTNREFNGNTITVTWNGELGDDGNLSVTRVLPQRGGGGFGRGPGVGPPPGDPPPGGAGRGGFGRGRGGRGGGGPLVFRKSQ